MKLLRITFACILVIYLFFSIGIKNIVSSLLQLDVFSAIMVVGLLFLICILGAVNFWVLLNINKKLPFKGFFHVYIHSWALSLITPGQLGDLSLPFFLKKQGVSLRQSSAVYIIDKIISLSVLIFVILAGLPYIFPAIKVGKVLLAVFAALIVVILLLTCLGFFCKHIDIVKRMHSSVRLFINEVASFKNKIPVIISNGSITIVKWGVLSLTYLLAFVAFKVQVDWPEVGLIPMLSTLIGYIPISVGGVGTVEVTSVYLFGLQGVQEADVISVYILLRLGQFLIALLLLTFGYFTDLFKRVAIGYSDEKN